MKLTFNKNYFLIFLLVFITEVLIALYIHDDFIRPYLGDVLVVILMYCFLKSFLKLPVMAVAWFVLCFAFAIEGLQSMNLVEKLGLEQSGLARTVLGTSFSWLDLLTYIIGFVLIIAVENRLRKKITV